MAGDKQSGDVHDHCKPSNGTHRRLRTMTQLHVLPSHSFNDDKGHSELAANPRLHGHLASRHEGEFPGLTDRPAPLLRPCDGIGISPIAGIISAIVSRLLISHINGVPLGISGPAAGLTTVLFSAIQTLGQGDHWAGYRYVLAAVVTSGGLQILLGLSMTAESPPCFPPPSASASSLARPISCWAPGPRPTLSGKA